MCGPSWIATIDSLPTFLGEAFRHRFTEKIARLHSRKQLAGLEKSSPAPLADLSCLALLVLSWNPARRAGAKVRAKLIPSGARSKPIREFAMVCSSSQKALRNTSVFVHRVGLFPSNLKMAGSVPQTNTPDVPGYWTVIDFADYYDVHPSTALA